VHQHLVARSDAARLQAGGKARHPVGKLRIRPLLSRASERPPDQERVAGALAGLDADQAADVLAGERLDVATGETAHTRVSRCSCDRRDYSAN
jgi:hypothetical protein